MEIARQLPDRDLGAPWLPSDPLSPPVHSTEKGDVICYYGNRGEPEPVVLAPGKPTLVGGDKVGAASVGTLLFFSEPGAWSYFSPGIMLLGRWCALCPHSGSWPTLGPHVRPPIAWATFP